MYTVSTCDFQLQFMRQLQHDLGQDIRAMGLFYTDKVPENKTGNHDIDASQG